MEEKIKELTMLLLYLTSWEEKEKFLPKPLCRSWKGYPFDILDKLEEEGFITQGRKSKSALITEEGKALAERLKEKYIISDNEQEDNASSASRNMPDMRSMERMSSDLSRSLQNKLFDTEDKLRNSLKDMVKSGHIPKMTPKEALDIAQDIIYDAWEINSRKKRIDLAYKALSISANCADAYVILAEEKATTYEEACKLYQEGVEAGERTLGKKAFKEDIGHFWGMLKTRPYMRARAGLAECLWELGERDEAIGHCCQMLRLNPNDNQGIRYILASCLAKSKNYAELNDLLNKGRYKNDPSCEWYYTQTLLIFREEGSSKKADEHLTFASKTNPYVSQYLTGIKRIPKVLPDMIALGSEDEAMCYASRFISAWKEIPDAIEWLKEKSNLEMKPKAKRNEPCPCGSGNKYKKCCGR